MDKTRLSQEKDKDTVVKTRDKGTMARGKKGLQDRNRNAAEYNHPSVLHPQLPPCRGGGMPPLCDHSKPLGG